MNTKSELINWLGLKYKYTKYLEVATLTTGHQFSLVNQKIYSTNERIMYRLPPGYDDEMPISCRSPSDDSSACFKSLLDQGKKFDVVFVDPFHTYEASRRDIELALMILNTKGTLVVHDCNPPDKRYVSPHLTRGDWLGETYLAFIDIARENYKVDHCVVDIDWGCGVIRFNNSVSAAANDGGMIGVTCKSLNDYKTRIRQKYYDWEYFDKHRNSLLNLISTKEFKRLVQSDLNKQSILL